MEDSDLKMQETNPVTSTGKGANDQSQTSFRQHPSEGGSVMQGTSHTEFDNFTLDQVPKQAILVPAHSPQFDVKMLVLHSEAGFFLRKMILDAALRQFSDIVGHSTNLSGIILNQSA